MEQPDAVHRRTEPNHIININENDMIKRTTSTQREALELLYQANDLVRGPFADLMMPSNGE